MKEFPKTLPWGHSEKGVYNLVKAIGIDYAFYRHDLGFGFKHGISIVKVYPKGKPEKILVQVRMLSGNSWGKGSWIIINEKFFRSLEDAIGHLNGKTRIYKPKRKPELIRPMTNDEVMEYWNIKVEIKT